jgi:hypothetical protein
MQMLDGGCFVGKQYFKANRIFTILPEQQQQAWFRL